MTPIGRDGTQMGSGRFTAAVVAACALVATGLLATPPASAEPSGASLHPNSTTATLTTLAQRGANAKARKRFRANAYEAAVLRLTNVARGHARSCGTEHFDAVGPVKFNAKLGRAARRHSSDMATHNYFAHNSQAGRTPGDRIEAAGYRNWTTWGENIAAGQQTPADVVTAWLNSPGHCSNLMHSAFTELGVGYAKKSGNVYGKYWTQDFGAR